MKTFVRVRAVANSIMKSVKKDVIVKLADPKPDYDNMEYRDLKLCARNEGIKTSRKKKATLIAELWEAYGKSV